MAALAKERYPSRQKPGMVTSMDFMTNHAIFLNRGVLECIRTPLFRMAFITKFVYRIGFDHCLTIRRRTHSIVAARTVDLSLSDRMMRLFIGLRPDVLMT
jgi:hypothetical protein